MSDAMILVLAKNSWSFSFSVVKSLRIVLKAWVGPWGTRKIIRRR